MANGQTDIPWDRLVSNLSWSTDNRGKNPDIRLLSRPTTEADLSQFAGVFTESIQKASGPQDSRTSFGLDLLAADDRVFHAS